MRTYGQYCPIARAAEVFAERWTPLIIRNIALGCDTFTEILHGAPGLSRTLLADRLRELERRALVARDRSGPAPRYTLTEAGEGLWDVCRVLGTWGAHWMELTPDHLDPAVVLWTMCHSADPATLPHTRVVVRIDFPAARKPNRFWLLYDRGELEVCIKPPGETEDLVVTADPAGFARWHMGWTEWAQELRSGHITIAGPTDLARAFPTWNARSTFAGVPPHPDVVAAAPRGAPVTPAHH